MTRKSFRREQLATRWAQITGILLLALTIAGSVQGKDAASDQPTAETVILGRTISDDFDPGAHEGWQLVGPSVWEKDTADLMERYGTGAEVGEQALSGIRRQLATLEKVEQERVLTLNEELKRQKLRTAEALFERAIADLRNPLGKSITVTDSGSACGGNYSLRIDFSRITFVAPVASADASFTRFGVVTGPYDPLAEPTRYTYTVTRVASGDGQIDSTFDLDYHTSGLGTTTQSHSTAVVGLPTDPCAALAEAYYVHIDATPGGCGTQIYGYTTTRKLVSCNTF